MLLVHEPSQISPVIKKQVSLDLPPCPLKTSYDMVSLIKLPSKTPVPILTLKFSGTAELHDDSGASLGKVDVSGSVSPK